VVLGLDMTPMKTLKWKVTVKKRESAWDLGWCTNKQNKQTL